ncbi:uncharacterized protein LOC131325314 [Rhododendron vialii]|uniref:uncharacterized protein LOC131325314 n=1 Tax=Rhododendron vialii TaxID=182163 RepID=UPI00265FB5C7|nr:uncharacterized protein LOC131325314 [Rhododendron vialii]
MILGHQYWWLMPWQSSAVSFLYGKSSLVMIVLMLLTKILKLDKRPTKLKESDTKRVVMNSRGMKLFSCRWLPANREPKALVFLCHGYSMESSISMKGQYISLSSLIVTIECQNGDKKKQKQKQSTLRPGRKRTGTRLAKAGYGVWSLWIGL